MEGVSQGEVPGFRKMSRAFKGLTFAYQPPMFRPFENYPMALLPEVYEEASQELLDLLGFKVWFGVGHLGDRNAERISHDTPIIGEMKP